MPPGSPPTAHPPLNSQLAVPLSMITHLYLGPRAMDAHYKKDSRSAALTRFGHRFLSDQSIPGPELLRMFWQ